MASFIAIIRYALLETFFCISILAKTFMIALERKHSKALRK